MAAHPDITAHTQTHGKTATILLPQPLIRIFYILEGAAPEKDSGTGVAGEGSTPEPAVPRPLPPPPPTGLPPPAGPADGNQSPGPTGGQPAAIPAAVSQAASSAEGLTPPPPPPRGTTLPPAIPPRRCDKPVNTQPAPAQSSQQAQYISATSITVSHTIIMISSYLIVSQHCTVAYHA